MSFCLIASAFSVLFAADVAKSPVLSTKTTSGLKKVDVAVAAGSYSADSIIVQKIINTAAKKISLGLTVAIITDSANGRIVRLYLSGSGPLILTPEIGNLSALTYLDLSWDSLASIPGEIGNLSALTFLNLSNNGLTTLPGEIGKLSALKALWAYNNKLTSLPGDIIYLKLPPDTTVSIWYPPTCGPYCTPIIDTIITYPFAFTGNQLCNLPDSIKNWVMQYAPGTLQSQTCANRVKNISAVQTSNLFKIAQTQNSLLISCASLQDEDLKLQIFTSNGRLIKSEKLHGNAGRLSYALSKSFLPKGMNIIQLSGQKCKYLLHTIIQ
jgi:Leucine-rich repeat (LRR) protein